MLARKAGQAMVEYLFLITVVAISLLVLFLLSQEVLVTLYNQIWNVITNNS